MNKQDEISFLLRPKFWKNLQRIRKLDVDKFLFSLDSLVNLSINDEPLNRDVLDEDENFIDVLVASLFDAFESEITSSVERHKDGLKSKALPANGHKHFEFDLTKKILFSDTDENYQNKLKAIIDKDVEKGISTITFDDFCARLEKGKYKYDNFLIAYKTFCKNEKPKKEPTKEEVEKIEKITNDNLEKAISMMRKELIEIVTTNEHKEIGMLDAEYCSEMESVMKKNSTQLDLNNYDNVQNAYKLIRDRLIKENNIYSMTYKSSKKNKPDETTQLLHFVNDFWETHDKKKFIFNNQECYVNGNSYEIVLNNSRMKKPEEHEQEIMIAVFNDEVEYI